MTYSTALLRAKQIVEKLGEEYSVREGYSGRGMYGKSCLGIAGPDLMEIQHEASVYGLGVAKTDSMGLNYIAYWPKISKEAP